MEHEDNIYKTLKDEFYKSDLSRPIRLRRYQAGDALTYDITTVHDAYTSRVHLQVESFVGGGFAGQVYRVKVLEAESSSEENAAIMVGNHYAMKILIPPSGFSETFRNALYWIGFQGPFQLQINPHAARAGAIWQKFIRRGAKLHFGDERAVVDIYATFIDQQLGSCGELSEWIEGRTWHLEVDDHIDLLGRWQKGKKVDESSLGSAEYREKFEFMKRFVELLHEMGGHEFARQYEWSTWKSQPNCLRRTTEGNPNRGLVAVDFRAGLTLLPFLPMSPGDFSLILTGLLRGSLVQFDRGDLLQLERYIDKNKKQFSDMHGMLKELKSSECVYRNSVPDITHNHIRLIYSSQLWSTIFRSTLVGWKIRNLVDFQSYKKFQKYKILVVLFFLLGLVPFLGKVGRRIWARADWRAHYKRMITDWDYFQRAFRARAIEMVIDWLQTERISDEKALRSIKQSWRLSYHLPLSFLPTGLHRFLTDYTFAKQKIIYYTIRPVRLYFSAELREQWLLDMLKEGQKGYILSREDADTIAAQIGEPFIQKYLKSLAVHVCTLPVTQIVSVIVAIVYIAMHPELPRAQAYTTGLGIIAIFQILPMSPGSIVRGLYVLYLVIRERNFKDYNIAVFLGFFKYIGYLAFPIQMTYRYPALARFMAAYWATGAVHVVPVFGERGALLEHKVYELFYNWPLTIRRRIRERNQMRALRSSRYWHVMVFFLLGSLILGVTDFILQSFFGKLSQLKDIWILVVPICIFCGGGTAYYAGGAEFGKRLIGAAICGIMIGILHTSIPVLYDMTHTVDVNQVVVNVLWRVFIYTICTTIGALYIEAFSQGPTEKFQS